MVKVDPQDWLVLHFLSEKRPSLDASLEVWLHKTDNITGCEKLLS